MGMNEERREESEALVEAITGEVRLLEDLVGVMRRQHRAVIADDLQAIDDSVAATHRVLSTLGEAHRRRRVLIRMATGVNDFPLRHLERAIGDRMTPELQDARDALHAAVLTLARELEVNRAALRRAGAGESDAESGGVDVRG